MLRKVVFVVALAFLAGTVAAGAAEILKSPDPVKGQYIVVLKDDAVRTAGQPVWAGQRVSQVASEMALVHGAKVGHVYETAIKGFTVNMDEKAAAQLARDPRVAFIEEDGYVQAFATQSNPPWGLDRIDQRNRPLNSSYVYNTTASNVNAYIVDTGIRAAHTDFGGRVRSGYTAISDGRGTEDCNGHGTHVAGTVGGATYGVAKGVRLYPVRVLDCQGSGTNSGVIAGVDWVANNHVKPAVANMSLGGGASTALDSAVNNAISKGVSFVVAAGNENQNACNVSPARVANALTVGSTTSTDARSSFSNWGSCVNIFAPGSSILSAWYTSNTATNTISGTSMASPHAAGVAALYLAANTSATPSQVFNAIINAATTGVLTSLGTGSPNRLLYSLFDGGGGGGTAPCTGCTLYTGTLSGTGVSVYEPGGSYYYSAAGTHRGWLRGPAGTDFDLYLQRWNGSSWVNVASSLKTSYDEYISYNGTTGYYRWRIYSYSGSGTYQFWLQRP